MSKKGFSHAVRAWDQDWASHSTIRMCLCVCERELSLTHAHIHVYMCATWPHACCGAHCFIVASLKHTDTHSLSLSLTHTHTQTHTQIHKHTHRHTSTHVASTCDGHSLLHHGLPAIQLLPGICQRDPHLPGHLSHSICILGSVGIGAGLQGGNSAAGSRP